MVEVIGKVSSALAQGDIVREHGMRVRLVSDNRAHVEGVFSFEGEVLNLDEVRADGFVPIGWLMHRDPQDSRRPMWTIQGNDRVTWRVEVPA